MSDAILNDVVPASTIDSPFEESLSFRTVLSATEGGKEYRYKKWAYPKRKWKIICDARSESEINGIWNFYRAREGAYDTFLFESPNDSSAENPVINDVFATGDGVNTVFYLGNKFSLKSGDCYLLAGSLSVERSVGGTGDYSSFTDYSSTNSLGSVITNAPLPSGDVMRADYRFMYRVRFSTDIMEKRAFAYKLWSSEVEIVQVI
jgi:uncharacterized protein (TIGR02217 family)